MICYNILISSFFGYIRVAYNFPKEIYATSTA